MKDLIILRGLPGSGKSTLAQLLADNRWPSISIDDYFTDDQGNYRFLHRENHLAYESGIRRTEEAMEQGAEKIFLHNTFTLEWEMEPYFKLATRHGYKIFVCTVENYHGGSNQHGVTREQLEKMAAKYPLRLL